MIDAIPTKKRLNITLANGAVDDIEQLRKLLEQRTNERFSIAEVVKQLVKNALATEQN